MNAKLYHLAQINIARMNAPLDDPLMHGFVSRLDELNALADQSPGFVWRLQTDEGNATYLRPFDDDRILVNMSVWESIEHLKDYVYKSAHGKMLSERRAWFEKFNGMFMAMWWVEAGTIPTIVEAKRRLDYLQAHGETPRAFTFKRTFKPSDCTSEDFLVQALNPCPV